MRNSENWYHRSFFRSFCSSWNLPVYRKLYDWLEPGSNILDVGCGSGEFLLSCASKINSGTGLDLSLNLINQAKEKIVKADGINLTFLQKDFLNWNPEQKINSIVFIFVLHETFSQKREKMLQKALQLADNVLIADYVTPQPLNPTGLLNWLAEALTSKNHFSNFRHFNRTRWLANYIKDHQLKVLKSAALLSGTYQLLKLGR